MSLHICYKCRKLSGFRHCQYCGGEQVKVKGTQPKVVCKTRKGRE